MRRTPIVWDNSGANASPSAGHQSNRGPLGLRVVNDPSNPYHEVIFVHGLLGDSSLTWTYEHESATYWPDWLSEDKVFHKTRIHTYGYEAPPVNGRIAMSRVRDIGVELCSALESNGEVRRDGHVSGVGHGRR